MLCAAPESGRPHLSASATPARLTTLTLLLNVSATVTDYRGHRRTLFPVREYFPVHHVCRNYLKYFFDRKRTCPDWSLNPAPEARHAPLHTAPESADHWATWAGDRLVFDHSISGSRSTHWQHKSTGHWVNLPTGQFANSNINLAFSLEYIPPNVASRLNNRVYVCVFVCVLVFMCVYHWCVVDLAASLSQLEERDKKDSYDLEITHVKGRFVLLLHNLLSRHDQVLQIIFTTQHHVSTVLATSMCSSIHLSKV